MSLSLRELYRLPMGVLLLAVEAKLMLIQEFVTAGTEDKNHDGNSRDLDTFIKRISHRSVEALKAGEIVGPFDVPGAPLLTESPALFIGKVSRNLR